jgi:hypothetical protein
VKLRPKAANGCSNGCKNDSSNSPTNRARFFPLLQRRRRKLTLHSEFGEVSLTVDYGQYPQSRKWGCPVQRAWGLRPHQKLMPGLAEKLCFTVTATGSYEEAAAVASKWGVPVDDSTLHALVQRIGAQAEGQAQERLAAPAQEREPQRAATPLAVLMVDGWQVRQRGEGWGKRKTSKPRVEWHELKTGVFYRHEQAARTKGGRGLLADKVIVSWQGQPGELGRRLNWEAVRGGLGRARQTLFLGDGAAWVWNLQRDRWANAMGLLDFYHGSEHLWALGEAGCGSQPPGLHQCVETRLHELRHGREQKVLAQIKNLKRRRGVAGKIIERERHYFATHAGRMNYQAMSRRGWPIGSGAVESACRQKQCRFKRPGQFWTAKGLRHLCALDEARRNHHWNDLWTKN